MSAVRVIQTIVLFVATVAIIAQVTDLSSPLVFGTIIAALFMTGVIVIRRIWG